MRFKLWCMEHRYTARKIEEITGITRRSIFQYFQGVRVPSREREAFLMEKLGMPAGLFDRKE